MVVGYKIEVKQAEAGKVSKVGKVVAVVVAVVIGKVLRKAGNMGR